MEKLGIWLVAIFGVFLIGCGLLMLLYPERARRYLSTAGSTPFINYFEISLRMIPAAGLVLAADASLFPEAFRLVGWFMIGTSLVLFLIPRKWHHAYALNAANRLKPIYLRLLSPISFAGGGLLIYAVY
ncbi:MAG: hypothetical protein RIC30_09685 [Marinoscillum sp.]|uniref:hypothetical protein n=1 Tax=Marinoscillum sp. TaxID=2024838 RepID=UPI0032F1067E